MLGHNAVLDGPALLWIEAFEVARCRWHVRIVLLMIRPSLIPPLFAMARKASYPLGTRSALEIARKIQPNGRSFAIGLAESSIHV
jgi:hypothetical protein